MEEKIKYTLNELRTYALSKNVEAAFFYHEEDSYLMRFANSAISLNTNEHLVRLEITVHDGRKRASYEMITDLNQLEEMKKGLDIAAEMVKHAQPLNYQPSMAQLSETFEDACSFDENLANISNEERLAYFNQAVEGLESEDIKLSGVFSSGTNITAQMNTRSEHYQYFKSSDAQITIVLSHLQLKWEVIAEQSAHQKSDLKPAKLHRELSYLLERYQSDEAQQLPLGKYNVVFGPAATAEMLSFMNWIVFSGGSMKRGYSYLSENQVGKKIFNEKFTLVDDPNCLDTFPFKQDFMGIKRDPFVIFDKGVFKSFTWYQDDADEFGAKPTGHHVMHKSLVLQTGDKPVSTLDELVKMPHDTDILYIPYIHYMNIVNPSKALVTGSSRFGALLIKKDGSTVVPYNIRLTQSLQDVFGENLVWMSAEQTAYNTSSSYGARNPVAIVVPTFLRVNNLEISHSNSSY